MVASRTATRAAACRTLVGEPFESREEPTAESCMLAPAKGVVGEPRREAALHRQRLAPVGNDFVCPLMVGERVEALPERSRCPNTDADLAVEQGLQRELPPVVGVILEV